MLLRSSAPALCANIESNVEPDTKLSKRLKDTDSIIQLCEHWRGLSHNTDGRSKIIQASKH